MTSTYNKYIIAILSSNLIKYFIYKNSDKTGAGDIMLNVQSFEQIPIPQKTEEEQQPFIRLVDEILEAKQKLKNTKPYSVKLLKMIILIEKSNSKKRLKP